jgi:von Willebrand factor type A domain
MKLAPVFFPPELAEQQEFQEIEGGVGEVRTDLMRQLYFQRTGQIQPDELADRKLVSLVLDHAKRVIAHPSRPQILKKDSFLRFPWGEIALEETLEETPVLEEVTPETLQIEVTEEKPFTCVTMIDASSSMSGDKHLLASIAVAVLLYEIQSRDASVIVFASKAQVVKRLSVEEAMQSTVLKFLKAQPRGFTNIALGLEEGVNQFKHFGAGKKRVGLIATDGRSTEGGDPVEIAKQFDFLVVLHLHGPGSHLEASQAMAHHGNGICLEVETFEELPKKLYDAVRLLARR